MDRLELKHLAPYLPYKLMVSYDRVGTIIQELTVSPEKNKTVDIDQALRMYFLPLLRPISDLTKEITHGGDTFVPSLKLGIHHSKSHIKEFPKEFAIEKGCNVKYKNKGFYYYTFLTYFETQKLLEWHFDVFGLIERNLAINLNEVDNGK